LRVVNRKVQEIKVPADVWAHYQSLGTNLAALDAKLYALRTAYLAEVKEQSRLSSLGRLSQTEYKAVTDGIYKKRLAADAPIEAKAKVIAAQRKAIEDKYLIPDALPRVELPPHAIVNGKPVWPKTNAPTRVR